MARQENNLRNSEENVDPDPVKRVEDGAQRGATRGIHVVPKARGTHNIAPLQAAYEGSVTTRTTEGSGQGITTHSQSEESARQKKVVKDRPDGTASLNHGKST